MNEKIEKITKLLGELSDENLRLVLDYTKNSRGLKDDIVYYVSFGINRRYDSYYDKIIDDGVKFKTFPMPNDVTTHKIVFDAITKQVKSIELIDKNCGVE